MILNFSHARCRVFCTSVCSLLFVFCIISSGWSQVESPPTLALGVAGVVGEKGSIDVDVLAQLISEKQAELKKEFLKKSIFNDLQGHSYVIWEYMYSSMNVLLESESKEAIKQGLLKNSANLALVYGFCELYLQLATQMCNSRLDSLLMTFDQEDYKREFACPRNQARKLSIQLATLKQYTSKIGSDEISVSALLIDLVFEVMRSNKEITESLGFLTAPFPLGREYYENTSAYFRVKNHGSEALKKEVESMRIRLEKEIKVLLDNFILIRKLNDADMKLADLIKEYGEEVSEIVQRRLSESSFRIDQDTLDSSQLFDVLSSEIDTIYPDLRNIGATLDAASIRSSPDGNTAIAISEVKQDNKELSDAIAQNLAAFSRFLSKKTDFKQYDLYYLESSIKPLLIRLVSEKGFNPKYLALADDFDVFITYSLLKELDASLQQKPFRNLRDSAKVSDFSNLLELITRLDELDKVETYQFVLTSIQQVGDVFKDKKLGLYIKTLVDNLHTYTILNAEENQVEVAVEDIITRIYDKYANRQSGIFSLYFSIGVNQSINSNFSYTSLLPDTTGFRVDTTDVNSLAFASEKIGLKIKLLDVKWRRSFQVGETYHSRLCNKAHTVSKFKSDTPLVSDVYMLLYGSGLLYNIANLATEEEFNDPIAGIGVGVAFFNSLDLNVGYNWPLESDNDFFDSFSNKQIWTISFEVKITEYLSAVGRKRQAKK